MRQETTEEQYPHPLSDHTRALVFHAFKRALVNENRAEAARLERFAQADAELARDVLAFRRGVEENFA